MYGSFIKILFCLAFGQLDPNLNILPVEQLMVGGGYDSAGVDIDADGNIRVSGNLIVDGSFTSPSTGSNPFLITDDPATNRDIRIQTSDENRWVFRVNATAEGGSDAGSDLEIQSYDDDGILIDKPITIERADGEPIVFNRNFLIFVSDVSQTPSPSDLVIESAAGDSGISILSTTTDSGKISFGDSDSATAGQVEYDHSTDLLKLLVGGAAQFQVSSSSVTIIDDLKVDLASGDALFSINALLASGSNLDLNQAGLTSWRLSREATSRDLLISRYDVSGVFVDTPIEILAADGEIEVSTKADFAGIVELGSGNIQLNNADGKVRQAAIEQNSAATGDVLAWNGTQFAPTDAVDISDLVLLSSLTIDTVEANDAPLTFQQDNTNAWKVRRTGTSNDFEIIRYDSAGVLQEAALTLDFTNSDVYLPGQLIVGTDPTTVTNEAGEILLSAIEQDSAAIDQVPSWNGSTWVPRTITAAPSSSFSINDNLFGNFGSLNQFQMGRRSSDSVLLIKDSGGNDLWTLEDLGANARMTIQELNEFVLNLAGQDWDFTTRGFGQLALQGLSTGTQGGLEIFTADGNGTADNKIHVYAEGTVSSVTNRSRLNIGAENSINEFVFESEDAGSGTLRPISMWMDGGRAFTIGTDKVATFEDDLELPGGFLDFTTEADSNTTEIVSGAITATRSRHRLGGEGNVADNLDSIAGQSGGKWLWLNAQTSSEVITVRDADVSGGNIQLIGDRPFVMDGAADMLLLYTFGGSGNWFEAFRSSQDGHTMEFSDLYLDRIFSRADLDDYIDMGAGIDIGSDANIDLMAASLIQLISEGINLIADGTIAFGIDFDNNSTDATFTILRHSIELLFQISENGDVFMDIPEGTTEPAQVGPGELWVDTDDGRTVKSGT